MQETYRVDNFEKLQDHVLLTLDGAWLKYLEDGQESVCANNQILDLCIFPK